MVVLVSSLSWDACSKNSPMERAKGRSSASYTFSLTALLFLSMERGSLEVGIFYTL